MWLLIVVLLLLILLTPYGYYRRADYGLWPGNVGALLFALVLVLLLTGWRP